MPQTCQMTGFGHSAVRGQCRQQQGQPQPCELVSGKRCGPKLALTRWQRDLEGIEVELAAQPQVLPYLVPTRPAQNESKGRAIGVLLLNDGQITFDPLKITLSAAGYDVRSVLTAKEALHSLQSSRPDMVLINLSLQDQDGKHLVERLRHCTTAPIIVMSVRHEESEKVSCLDTGADDYLTRPFATAELLARLRAALRRAFGVPRSEVLTVGDLKIDFSTREVFVQQVRARLTATEYDLLRVLAAHAGAVKTHYQLIHELWGTPQDHNARHLLRVTVSHLRQKLVCGSSDRGHIGTEVGVGYRFDLV